MPRVREKAREAARDANLLQFRYEPFSIGSPFSPIGKKGLFALQSSCERWYIEYVNIIGQFGIIHNE